MQTRHPQRRKRETASRIRPTSASVKPVVRKRKEPARGKLIRKSDYMRLDTLLEF